MIKFPPSGTTARISLGLKPVHRRTIRGQLGEGARECRFSSGPIRLDSRWTDNGLDSKIHCESACFIREVSLEFHYRTPRPARETVLWTEAFNQDFALNPSQPLPGSLSEREQRTGAGALWLSESAEAEGIFFRQAPNMEYPILFQCRPGGRSLTISWRLNRQFSPEESLALPTVRMSRGRREKIAASWYREWRKSSNRIPSPDRRVGWFDGNTTLSPEILREKLLSLKSHRLPVDWFAMSPDYAENTGDWLKPREAFRDKMGLASRAISEQNYIPALRLAPFLVSRKSALAGEKKDWMVKASNGAPLTIQSYGPGKDSAWILDITRSDVRSHLEKMLSIMRDRWGFRAFVLERLEDVIVPGYRESPEMSPGALLDSAGEIIRGAVGDKVFLAATNLPLLAETGIWDARFVCPSPIHSGRAWTARPERRRLAAAAALLHRAPWSEGCWANASGPLPLEMFNPERSEATSSLIDATAISCGAVAISGDCRNMDEAEADNIKEFLGLFSECRSSGLLLAENPGGGRRNPLIVRNEAGWVGLFNISARKKEVRLDKDALKSALGVATPLSAGDGAVFNSPEIHVALRPRGHRLFRA